MIVSPPKSTLGSANGDGLQDGLDKGDGEDGVYEVRTCVIFWLQAMES